MPIRDVYALKMDKNSALQKRELFTEYLTRKGHRKTPERYAILDLICSINGHFDVDLLYKSLESANFHVSRATLYNTIELLVDSRLLVRHQFGIQGVQYECADRACTHFHLVCTHCGKIQEQKDQAFNAMVLTKKLTKFTPEYYSLYIFGLCSKCKYALKRKEQKEY